MSNRLRPKTRRVSLRAGFTLVELMTATALTLLVLAILTNMMGQINGSINEHRAAMNMQAELRGVIERLRTDLAGVTVRKMVAPRDPRNNEGYFKYVEGPYGPVYWPYYRVNGNLRFMNELLRDVPPVDATYASVPAGLNVKHQDFDATMGDNDDMLMFTTQSTNQPFQGRWYNVTVESRTAEVCWFIRGTTLYRRVLLVDPTLPLPCRSTTEYEQYSYLSYFQRFDISAHQQAGQLDPEYRNYGSTAAAYHWLVANSLGDLTKPENRYAHVPRNYHAPGEPSNAFPFDTREWTGLGLPNMSETSRDATNPTTVVDTTAQLSFRYPFPLYMDGIPFVESRTVYLDPMNPTVGTARTLPNDDPNDPIHSATQSTTFDPRLRPLPYNNVNLTTGDYNSYSGGSRQGEDIILRRVLSFDVKAWDPGAPLYEVDIQQTDASLPPKTTTKHVLLRPGDNGYLARVNTSNTPISCGAFVDLNYLCLLGPRLAVGGSTYSNGQSWDNFMRPYEPRYPYTAPEIGSGDPRFYLPRPQFHGPGHPRSQMFGQTPTTAPTRNWPNMSQASVYDTWSNHYESDGIDQGNNGTYDEGADGYDNNGIGGVDDPSEAEAPPPYSGPLRAIQVTIRVFDPDTEQIRELSLVQNFEVD